MILAHPIRIAFITCLLLVTTSGCSTTSRLSLFPQSSQQQHEEILVRIASKQDLSQLNSWIKRLPPQQAYITCSIHNDPCSDAKNLLQHHHVDTFDQLANANQPYGVIRLIYLPYKHHANQPVTLDNPAGHNQHSPKASPVLSLPSTFGI